MVSLHNLYLQAPKMLSKEIMDYFVVTSSGGGVLVGIIWVAKKLWAANKLDMSANKGHLELIDRLIQQVEHKEQELTTLYKNRQDDLQVIEKLRKDYVETISELTMARNNMISIEKENTELKQKVDALEEENIELKSAVQFCQLQLREYENGKSSKK